MDRCRRLGQKLLQLVVPGVPDVYQGTELVETGGYLDPQGNNFWGVETFKRNGRTIILGSDRDSGLWVFERTG